jgi:hypothetical protein
VSRENGVSGGSEISFVQKKNGRRIGVVLLGGCLVYINLLPCDLLKRDPGGERRATCEQQNKCKKKQKGSFFCRIRYGQSKSLSRGPSEYDFHFNTSGFDFEASKFPEVS